MSQVHDGPASDPIFSELRYDEGFSDLIEMFVSDAHVKQQLFMRLFDAADWDGIRSAAHQLKGSAGGYGFPELSTLAGRLCEACQNLDMVGIQAELRHTIEYLDRMVAE